MQKIQEWLEKLKARIPKEGLFKASHSEKWKTGASIVAMIALAALVIVTTVKLIEVAFSAVYAFFERHFFGIGLALGLWFYYRTWRQEQKEQRQRQLLEEKAEQDKRMIKFAEGAYDKIRKFLYTLVLIEPNFEELTGLYRPLSAAEMGSARNCFFISNGMIHYQFRIPKRSLDTLSIATVTSIIQSMIEQKISIYGIPDLLSPTHDSRSEILIVSRVSDMKTYAELLLVLDWDGNYMEQAAYDRSIIESINRSNVERTLEDCDYD